MNGKTNPQNLINQVSPQAERFRPGFWKQIGLDILTVASAGGAGYAYSGYLAGSLSFGVLLGTLALFAIFSTFQTLLAKGFGRRVLVLILEIAALLVFFLDHEIKILFAAAIIIFAFSLLGFLLSRREMGNSLEIKFFKITRPTLSKLTTAIILVLIVLYVPIWSHENIFVSQEFFFKFFDWAANVIVGFYPEIKLNASFAELADGIAMIQLRTDPLFAGRAPGEQAEILRQTVTQVAGNLERSFGVEIKPGEPISGAVYNYIINLLRGWHERFGSMFLLAWGLGIFLVVRGFGIIFYWFVGVISFIIYQILIASGFIYMTGETRTHEIIDW